MKPLLLVDVDGVLNCFGSLWSEEYEQQAFIPDVPMSSHGHPIRIPKLTAERLAKLSEHFEMVWCTAWQEDAHPFFAEILGLEEWPVIEFSGWDGSLHAKRSWKWSWVDRYVDYSGDAPRPAAWIDDDLHRADFEWAARRTAGGVPTLLVKAEPCFGLTDADMHDLIYWARTISRGVPV